MSHYAMKVYFQERIWLYFFIWRQPDSEEAEGFRAEPGEVEQSVDGAFFIVRQHRQ